MRDRPGVRQGQQVESHSHRWPYRHSGPVTGIRACPGRLWALLWAGLFCSYRTEWL